MPIVADIHFHYKRAIEAAEAGAACLRINPGNIGCAERVREVVQGGQGPRLLDAHRRQCRLAGDAICWRNTASPARRRWSRARSTTPRILEDNDFHEFKISVKASDVFLAVAAYQQLAEAMRLSAASRHHRGGRLRTGTVKSSIGMGSLLWAGIGDTIRVSLSADPVEEIRSASTS